AAALNTSQHHPDLVAVLVRLADRLNTPATAQPVPDALSKEDATFLGVSVKTIECLIRVRRIESAQLGSQRGRVIPIAALRKLLEDNTQLTAQEELQRRRARR